MPNRPSHLPEGAEIEWAILDLLLEHPRPWRAEELIDAIDSPTAVAEALDALHAAGIIERGDPFVRIASDRH